MLLTAQRVMQPNTRLAAIHAFHYRHLQCPYIWDGPPPPDLGEATLVAQRVRLYPLGQNSVLTYLDIIAPDDVSTPRIVQAFAQLYDQDRPPPFSATIGNCTFEANMIHAYLLAWRQEVVVLFQEALAIRTATL